MKKSIWRGSFSISIPPYPCPTCKSGVLKKKKKDDLISHRAKDPSFEQYETNPPAWPSRFSLFLKCDVCAEVVVISGTSIDVPEEMLDGGMEWFEHYEPESMSPAPPIISTEGVPKSIRLELQKSFGLYWMDTSACASRMRTSLERLMDHFKVPTTTLATSRSGTRYRRRLELASRIDKFASKLAMNQYSAMLHALRVVGNIGTHGKKAVSKAEMLDAYKLYEHALGTMFEDKKESINEIIKRLRKLK